MKKRIIALLILIFGVITYIQSQEFLTGMHTNQYIQQYRQTQFTEKQTKDLTAVKMPFLDDFSSTYVYPTEKLWADKDVFINNGYAINSLTVGCATFDAFDAQGELHENASSFYFIADYLTSHPIRLDSIFGVSAREATIADSIYLSFYYQPQGLGEKPERDDSLVVQFFNPAEDKWITMWSAAGSSYQAFKANYGVDFKSVNIPILNPDFLSPDFRFRFYNIASLANNDFQTWVGNVDHWHIDYVYLNAERHKNDTLPVDVAFQTRASSLLKNYNAMPWSHFLTNPAQQMVNEVNFPYNNYSGSLINLTEQIIISDISGTLPPYNSGISAVNVEPYSKHMFSRSPFPYVFASDVSENADFDVRFIINTATIPDMIRTNDTLFFYQKFYNYFSYDDGIPEAGYALVGKNAKLAYQFVLSHPDTLRAVQVQFNRVANNVNENLYFSLQVRNDVNGKPGQVIFEQSGLKPVVSGLYGFHIYELDEPLPVQGTIYIGWIQQEETALNVGFDRNNIRNNRIFFNVDGEWLNSMYEGALMIRPIVGSSLEPYLSIGEQKEAISSLLHVYPNPVRQGDNIYIEGVDFRNSIVEIYSLDGRFVEKIENTSLFNTQVLHTGMYIIVTTHTLTQSKKYCKIIVTK